MEAPGIHPGKKVERRQVLRAGALGAIGAAGLAISGRALPALALTPQPSDILATLNYNPDPNPFPFTAGNSWTAIPPARVTFTVPSSGRVLVAVAAAVRVTLGGAQGYWRFANSAGSPVPNTEELVTVSPSTLRISSRVLIDGLAPGSTQTWTMQQFSTAGQILTFAGRGRVEAPGYGPLTIVVIAA